MENILLNELKKVSAANHESPECLEYDNDEKNLFHVVKMSLEEIKVKN